MTAKIIRKCGFTLIELLIFFSLIAIVAVVVTVRSISLISYHRFSSSSTLFYDALCHLQNLAIIHNMDCRLILSSDNTGYYFTCETDAGLLRADLLGKRVFLPSIDEVRIGKELLREKIFMIYSSGIVDPKDLIEFKYIRGEPARSLYVDLTAPITLQLRKDKPQFRPQAMADVPFLPH